MALLAWASYGLYDAAGFVGNFFLETPGDYSRDPELVEWFTQAETTIDSEEREELYARGLRKIADEAYIAPLYVYSTFYAYNEELDFTPPQDGALYLYLVNWAD
jgi:peptide/nickel transport system substrate-binding protein